MALLEKGSRNYCTWIKRDLLSLFLSGSYFFLHIWWDSFPNGWENGMHLSPLQEATELGMSGPAKDWKVRTSVALWACLETKHNGESCPCSVPTAGLCLCRKLQSAFGCWSGVVATFLMAWLYRVQSAVPAVWILLSKLIFFSGAQKTLKGECLKRHFNPLIPIAKSKKTEAQERPFIDFADINVIHLLFWTRGREMFDGRCLSWLHSLSEWVGALMLYIRMQRSIARNRRNISKKWCKKP